MSSPPRALTSAGRPLLPVDRRRVRGAAIAASAATAWAFGLACGSGAPSTPIGAGNAAACLRYANHLNELSECVGLVYDPKNLCIGAELADVDMTAYYACLVDGARCDAGAPVLDGDDCEPPLVAIAAGPDAGPAVNVGGALPTTAGGTLRSAEEEAGR